ncbi:MAG TPA: response regulator transcription factor [Ilumatobacteraceae bacterium]|nr:response regulator transcription factor [Ilumatobacteraceae bacterium]
MSDDAGTAKPITVLVVDDHHVVRHGLEQLLTTAHGIEVVGTASDGLEAVEAVGRLNPDVVLMDLSMPQLDGVEATRRIVASHPSSRVLVLTSFSEQSRILDAISAGAEGYLLKHSDPDEITAAVRAVHAGEAPLDPKAARVLLDAGRTRRETVALSEREREVLLLVRDGLANKQIARKLGITERTVKAHLTKIFQRIDASGRTQAAIWAAEHLT